MRASGACRGYTGDQGVKNAFMCNYGRHNPSPGGRKFLLDPRLGHRETFAVNLLLVRKLLVGHGPGANGQQEVGNELEVVDDLATGRRVAFDAHADLLQQT